MAYSPEEAQAAVAGLVANPIPATSRQMMVSGGAFNSWDIRWIAGMPGKRYEDVRIEDQEAEPNNPGIREVTASTYGQTIPVSLGRRRLPGNIIQSTQMVPRLVGGFDYEITYRVPVYSVPPDDKPHSVEVNPSSVRPRPDPSAPPGKCNEDPCNPPPPEPNTCSMPAGYYAVNPESIPPSGCEDISTCDGPRPSTSGCLGGCFAVSGIQEWYHNGNGVWSYVCG
jgi:hypothetical protein